MMPAQSVRDETYRAEFSNSLELLEKVEGSAKPCAEKSVPLPTAKPAQRATTANRSFYFTCDCGGHNEFGNRPSDVSQLIVR